jgi:hypothetical protein
LDQTAEKAYAHIIKVDAFLRLQPMNSDSDDDSIEDRDADSSDYDGSCDDGFYEKHEPNEDTPHFLRQFGAWIVSCKTFMQDKRSLKHC